jgi:hypothetical protein
VSFLKSVAQPIIFGQHLGVTFTVEKSAENFDYFFHLKKLPTVSNRPTSLKTM